MSRRTKILFGLSLALNLLVLGFVIGVFVAGPHMFFPGHFGGPPRPFQASMGMAWLLHDLPAERREALRPAFDAAFTQLRPQMRAMRDAQRNVAASLEREQFDRAELARALAAMQSRMRLTEQAGQNALIELATRLTWEERKQLARNLRAPPFMRRGRGGHGPTDRHTENQPPPG